MKPVARRLAIGVKRGAASFVLLACAAAPADTQRIRRASDTAPPRIRIESPAPGARVESFTPAIELAYDDEGSGVAVVSFRAFINERDYSAIFDHHSRGASGRVPTADPLPLGENKLVVELADRMGNVGRAEATFVNAGGGWLAVTADPGVGPKRYGELVLDASGSMSDKILDNTRMAVAKGAVKGLVKALPSDLPLGLRVFSACDSIKSLVPIAVVDKAAFAGVVDKIQPAGGTPIVASLLQAFEALAKFNDGERVVVLVTDGGESCNGSFAEAIERAKEPVVRVIIIGFDIDDAGITDRLRSLAESTGGAFFDAQDSVSLQQALEKSVLRLGFGVYDQAATRVASGDVNGERLMLPVGAYQVRFDVALVNVAADVRIGPLAAVSVRLRRAAGGFTTDVTKGEVHER